MATPIVLDSDDKEKGKCIDIRPQSYGVMSPTLYGKLVLLLLLHPLVQVGLRFVISILKLIVILFKKPFKVL